MRVQFLPCGLIVLFALSASTVVRAGEPVRLAVLSEVSGKVLVNAGKGFVTAKSGAALNLGDRVISLDGSRAAVVYADGCTTRLPENSLLALDASAPCGKAAVRTGAGADARASGATTPSAERMLLAQAIGGKSSDAGGKKEEDDDRLGFWIWGGVAGLGVLVVGTAKDDKPISQQ